MAVIVAAVLGCRALAAGEVTATAPATLPAGKALSVALANRQLTFEFQQDGRAVNPGPDGHIHLRPASFEVDFSGDVDQGLVIAQAGDSLARALEADKRPVVIFQGSGGAAEQGELLVVGNPAVGSWEQVREPLFGTDSQAAAEAETKLQQRLGQTPDVLDCVVQSISTFAPDDAKEWTFAVNKMWAFPGRNFTLGGARGHEQPLAEMKTLTLIVCVEEGGKEMLQRFGWRAVHLDFDVAAVAGEKK